MKPGLEIRDVPLHDLVPDDKNPRSITSARFAALRRTVRENPDLLRLRPIIARDVARKPYPIVAGEMRWRACDAEGWETVPAAIVTLDDQRETIWRMLDNNPFGEWVEQELAEMLYGLEQEGVDLELTGFTNAQTTKLLDSVRGPEGGHVRWPDEPAPDPPANPTSKPGRVYKLGRHRLICGDATDPKIATRLLAGAKPLLIATDPPYGVELELGWRDDGGKVSPGGRPGRHRPGNTSMQGDDRADWSTALEHCPSALAVYHWFADIHVAEVVGGLRRIGFEVAQFIVWDKMAFALSRSHYHWQHEAAVYAARAGLEVPWYGPVEELAIYARRAGSKTPFLGDRNQTTIWSAPSPKRRRNEPEEGDEMVDHPTQKPALLWERPIKNHLLRGEALYDPFAGSGTCFIAAEMTDRVCYGADVDPAYCDVIRERYREYTR